MMARLGYQRKRLRDLATALSAGRQLAERERWPRERLERHQRERLEALVRHARERSAFWAGRLPRGRVSLEQLPIMEKVELMASLDELLTDHRLRSDELFAHLEGIDRDELYPSMAALLANEQLAGRLRLQLGGMSTSSEPLMPEVRERLERAFGVRPFNLYGTTEGLWGSDCEERTGIHLFEDMCIVENVDAEGRAVPVGEPGARVLVTNLFNRIQPLIRFEVSDIVTVEPEPYACGRTLMRLRDVEGRSEDVIEIGGVAVHPMQFAPLSADRAVREFQVVQEGERLRLRVALRAGANGAPQRLQATLAERLRETGVAQPVIEIDVVESLERSAAGKLRLIVADA